MSDDLLDRPEPIWTPPTTPPPDAFATPRFEQPPPPPPVEPVVDPEPVDPDVLGVLAESQVAIRLLAAAGGFALLLGLGFFVWYAVEQDWLTPALRFAVAAVTSAGLTALAWPIANRGHRAVAGAIGGAGLGAWFASWLVARHAHELVAAPETFVALGLGAGACLLIAERLELRLMAILASLAACATPILVSANVGGLGELMIYELVVLGVLIVIDARRRWHELPSLGLLSTWALLATWAGRNVDGDVGGTLLLACAALLLASAVSAWRLVHASLDDDAASERAQIMARLVVGGVLSWVAVAGVFGVTSSTFAVASVMLAVWHTGVGVLFERRGEPRMAAVFGALAWLQIFVVGPLAFDGPLMLGWWIAMSVIAAALERWGRAGLWHVVVPALAAVATGAWVDEPWSLGMVGIAAAVPFVVGLFARDADEGPSRAWLTLVSTLAWLAVMPQLVGTIGAAAVVLAATPIVVAIVVATVFAGRRDPDASRVGVAQLALGLSAALGLVVEAQGPAGLPDLLGGDGALALGAALFGLGVAGIIVLRRAWTQSLDARPVGIELVGLLVALGFGLGGLAALAPALGGGAAGLWPLAWTACIAATGLGLLIAGLRARESSWRWVGLTGMGVAAVKVMLFDLAHAAMIWRALSFVGLGVVLILGAFAYSRSARRYAGADGSSPA